MEKTKFSLSNIQDVLSRDEMREIMAGSDEECTSRTCDTQYGKVNCSNGPVTGVCFCSPTASDCPA